MGMEKGAMEGRGKERRGWAETEGRTQDWKGSWSRAAEQGRRLAKAGPGYRYRQ